MHTLLQETHRCTERSALQAGVQLKKTLHACVTDNAQDRRRLPLKDYLHPMTERSHVLYTRIDTNFISKLHAQVCALYRLIQEI